MKSAKEVARTCFAGLPDWNEHRDFILENIAQALTAYAEERVKEVEHKWRNTQWNQALEEAANLCEGYASNDELLHADFEVAAEKIRALKGNSNL